MWRLGYDAKRIFHNRTGLGNYGRDLIRILSANYPAHHYLLYNPKPAREALFKPSGTVEERLPQGWSRRVPALWRSKLILKDLKRDAVHLYHGLSGELPWGISRSGIPSVVTVHDLIFLRYPQWYKPFDRWIYKQKFLRAVAEADHVVAISEQTKRDILQWSGTDPSKISVIYQGCHPVFKEALPEAFLENVRRKWSLPARFLLQVGTIEPRKNAFTTVRALKDLPYHLYLVGRPTAYADLIKDFVRRHGMEDRIHFLQGLDLRELAALYRLADLSVYPSLFEGFGIPLIESLYSGTPVVTNRHGVFPEAAGPGGIYLDDVTDAAEMRAQIERWMRDDEGRRRLARQGREYVSRFDDEVLAAQWMELYNAVLRRKS